MAGRGQAVIQLKFNLRNFLAREGHTLIKSYQRLMQVKQGISLDPAPHNAAATIKRKGKDHWMIDTGKLKRSGFRMLTWPMRLKVYASTDIHTRGKKRDVSYEDLFLWHNQGHIGKRYSGIFNKFPAGSRFPERLSTEVYRQMRPQLEKAFTRRIKAK